MIYSLIDAYPFNTADPAKLVEKLRNVKESLKHSLNTPGGVDYRYIAPTAIAKNKKSHA